MSKKKNTLQDLDDFLKQTASQLVPPKKLTGENEVTPPRPPSAMDSPVSAGRIIDEMEALALLEGQNFRETLCALILRAMESKTQLQGEDVMLINTALYLQAGNNWKEHIRNYWNSKKYEPINS